MIKNYAGTVGVGIATLLITIFILCPFVVETHIGGIHNQVITPTEWMNAFTTRCIWTIVVCTASVLAWIYLSSDHYPVDYSGKHTQMPYWILHAIPPLMLAVVSYLLLPSIADGSVYALMVIILPMLFQFWISSLLFSVHRTSVLFGNFGV
jgi:hypothetical protein